MTTEHRHLFYRIRGIVIELVNPVKELGATREDLYGEADRWAGYAEAVSRGTADSIDVKWDGMETIHIHVVRRV